MFLLKIRPVKKMLRFDLPSDVDLYFDFKVVTLALIGIMFFFFSSGQNTLYYLEFCSGTNLIDDITGPEYITITETPLIYVNFTVDPMGKIQTNGDLIRKFYLDNAGKLMQYKRDLTKQQYQIPMYMIFLYFIVLPLIDVVFIIYWWKKGDFMKPKDLYIKLFSIKSGDLKNG